MQKTGRGGAGRKIKHLFEGFPYKPVNGVRVTFGEDEVRCDIRDTSLSKKRKLLENGCEDFGPIPNIAPVKRLRELLKIRSYEFAYIVRTLMAECSLLFFWG